MERRIPWLWIAALGLLIVAPGLTARLFVDVLEGITLFVVLGPLVLAGVGALAWFWFQRRLRTCPSCGTPSLGSPVCPACGTSLDPVPARGEATTPLSSPRDIDARDVTIDVSAASVDDEN